MQALWLAGVEQSTKLYSNIYKQTDEFQWSMDLVPRRFEDLATKVLVYTNEYGLGTLLVGQQLLLVSFNILVRVLQAYCL